MSKLFREQQSLLTLDEILGIGGNLYPHNRRRMRVQSCPGFIQHFEPLGVLVHRFRIGRGQEELDAVVGVCLEGWECTLNDGDGVLQRCKSE